MFADFFLLRCRRLAYVKKIKFLDGSEGRFNAKIKFLIGSEGRSNAKKFFLMFFGVRTSKGVCFEPFFATGHAKAGRASTFPGRVVLAIR